jgi:hypothetical protein
LASLTGDDTVLFETMNGLCAELEEKPRMPPQVINSLAIHHADPKLAGLVVLLPRGFL